MSLIDAMMETCILMDKSRVSDGEGGFTTSWHEGAEIQCVITNDTSMQARIGESQGVTSTYTITTRKTNMIEFHDVLKRKSDGKIFRITSNPDDKVSPAFGGLDMKQATAEGWKLT